MGELVEFPLDDGGVVVVEVSDAGTGGGPTFRGLDGARVTDQAHRTFQDAVGRVRPAAQALIAQLRSLADPPDETLVTFGLNLHAQAGAFIAETGADANFTVALTWRRS